MTGAELVAQAQIGFMMDKVMMNGDITIYPQYDANVLKLLNDLDAIARAVPKRFA